MTAKYLLKDPQQVPRCWWSGSEPVYVRYHDLEWGKPVKDNRTLFEKICLEGFQSGLSWLTVLRKREAFREAFERFDVERVARFDARKVSQLMRNDQIIRHRGKIEATINNARRAIELEQQFDSLAGFLWQFEPRKPLKFNPKRGMTSESSEMSKQLKKQGWKFVGPTTCYSLMQAMGMVNDHHPGCHRYPQIAAARDRFKRPSPNVK